MQLNKLEKSVHKANKRTGQGHGSGRGKTAGRGTKGQKAKRSIPLYFEGGALPLKKRIPFRRGKGRNKAFKNKPLIVNIKYLNLLPAKSQVNLQTLIDHRIVEAKHANQFGVKILGNGEVKKVFTILLPVSKNARIKIEKAGGVIELIANAKKVQEPKK